jgi:transcriptional regulator with XRE-family HTH domain
MSDADLKTRLGHNLRQYRASAGLSQEAFADMCGLHRTHIGAIERGERNVTIATLEKLAAALQIDPLDLLIEPDEA